LELNSRNSGKRGKHSPPEKKWRQAFPRSRENLSRCYIHFGGGSLVDRGKIVIWHHEEGIA